MLNDGISKTRPFLRASNRLRYLDWMLQRAGVQPAHGESAPAPTHDEPLGPLFFEHKFEWYAERVHSARGQLDAEFDRAHTVAALARSVGMSVFHFTRVFAELIGQPPHRYLKDVRLTAARAMLRQGRTVTDACFESGFNNLSHFSRSFAQRFGVTPSRWRAEAASKPTRVSIGC